MIPYLGTSLYVDIRLGWSKLNAFLRVKNQWICSIMRGDFLAKMNCQEFL